MDTQQVSAPVRAPRPVPADASPKFGVMHVKARLTSHFTVLGNQLTQHRELSLLAIGLSAHIQSLPPGARIGIKFLAQRFPDSEARIAAALRELEAHGFLRRVRERLDDGRVVTRTYSYNQPHTDAPPRPVRAAPSAPAPTPVPAPASEHTPVPPVPPAPLVPSVPPVAPVAPVAKAPTAPPSPTAPLPQPRTPLPSLPSLLHAATELLAGLHHHTPRITLTAQDVDRLAPAVAAWFERGATPADLRRALTDDLPDPLRHPAKLLRYRLTALLPPPPPAAASHVVPLRNCDRCDRAFRSPAPGHYCRDCTAAESPLLPE
ncbi:helix-turn-helix domain-containing protein [Streptomyces sp. NPDC015350]|uniref:helix-turn-helix domain-containing protein n=1 Tax=Streptomyces sp. NPDC015350 TaxID=3364955 RepID=UPI0036F63E4C